MCPRTPVIQITPQRNTKPTPVPLLATSHAPSQALTQEENPRREDFFLGRSSSHEKREMTNEVSHAHCVFYRKLEFCHEIKSVGIASHLRGKFEFSGSSLFQPSSQETIWSCGSSSKLMSGAVGWFSFLQFWAANVSTPPLLHLYLPFFRFC